MRAYWITKAAPEPTGIVVHVSPCGDYHPRCVVRLTANEVGRWEEVLGLPVGQLTAEPAACLGASFLAERPERPKRLWPTPGSTTRRPILLVATPARRSYGGRALEDAHGERLAQILGLTLSEVLESCEVRHLTNLPAPTSAEVEDAALHFLDAHRHRRLLVIGQAVTSVLLTVCGGGPRGAQVLHEHFASIDVLPHPSSKNPELADPAARRDLRQRFVRALCTARAVPLDRWPAVAEAVASIIADGWRDGWNLLRQVGVVAPSRRPLENWRRVAGGACETFERTWHDGSTTLTGPAPWRWRLTAADGRLVLAGDGGPQRDRVAAMLAVEVEALERGWVDVWEARNRALARVPVQTLDGSAGSRAKHPTVNDLQTLDPEGGTHG